MIKVNKAKLAEAIHATSPSKYTSQSQLQSLRRQTEIQRRQLMTDNWEHQWNIALEALVEQTPNLGLSFSFILSVFLISRACNCLPEISLMCLPSLALLSFGKLSAVSSL